MRHAFNLELTEEQANEAVQALDKASTDIRGRDGASVVARQMREEFKRYEN